MKEEKKSIINEALVDYKEILEAASQIAKTKLATDFPEKYENLLKEEIEKKKSKKELDETNKLDDTKIINEENDKTVMNNKEKETKQVVKEGVNNVPFTPDAKTVAEEFDVTGLGDGSENDEEYLSLDEIERELENFELPSDSTDDVETGGEENEPIDNFGGEENEPEEDEEADIKSQLLDLKLKLDSLINTLGGSDEESDEVSLDGEEEPEEVVVDNEPIDENDYPSDDEIDAILNNGNEDEIEESHGVAYPVRRNSTGRHTPNNDYLSTPELDQKPYIAESKKINGLMKENKTLTKKVNELSKSKKETDALVEKYKVVLGKYRTQINEMLIFNTNLSYVNNLLVNEEFALTQADKINIINGFKSVKTINESEEKYNSLITDLKNNKRIVESVENKVNDSIQPSSMSIVEKTVYSNDSHIGKMKRIIEKVEQRDKKTI